MLFFPRIKCVLRRRNIRPKRRRRNKKNGKKEEKKRRKTVRRKLELSNATTNLGGTIFCKYRN